MYKLVVKMTCQFLQCRDEIIKILKLNLINQMQ